LLAPAELAASAPGTRVTWAVRGHDADRAYGGQDGDALPARGALGAGVHRLVRTGQVDLVTGFAVRALAATAGGIEVTATDGRVLVADRLVAATGFRPDHTITEERRLDLDPILGSTRALAPLIDPN
jgi:hypothetical protein